MFEINNQTRYHITDFDYTIFYIYIDQNNKVSCTNSLIIRNEHYLFINFLSIQIL